MFIIISRLLLMSEKLFFGDLNCEEKSKLGHSTFCKFISSINMDIICSEKRVLTKLGHSTFCKFISSINMVIHALKKSYKTGSLHVCKFISSIYMAVHILKKSSYKNVSLRNPNYLLYEVFPCVQNLCVSEI